MFIYKLTCLHTERDRQTGRSRWVDRLRIKERQTEMETQTHRSMSHVVLPMLMLAYIPKRCCACATHIAKPYENDTSTHTSGPTKNNLLYV